MWSSKFQLFAYKVDTREKAIEMKLQVKLKKDIKWQDLSKWQAAKSNVHFLYFFLTPLACSKNRSNYHHIRTQTTTSCTTHFNGQQINFIIYTNYFFSQVHTLIPS